MDDSGIKSKVGKSTQDLAKKAAKQIAQEPFEVLKQAGRQVANTKETEMSQQIGEPTASEGQQISEEKEASINQKDKNLITAYEKELQDLTKNRQQEEREVVGEQRNPKPKQAREQKPQTPLVEPSTKPKRGLFSGIKGKVEKMKRKVEVPPGPTG